MLIVLRVCVCLCLVLVWLGSVTVTATLNPAWLSAGGVVTAATLSSALGVGPNQISNVVVVTSPVVTPSSSSPAQGFTPVVSFQLLPSASNGLSNEQISGQLTTTTAIASSVLTSRTASA
jgi:hypothetical protein